MSQICQLALQHQLLQSSAWKSEDRPFLHMPHPWSWLHFQGIGKFSEMHFRNRMIHRHRENEFMWSSVPIDWMNMFTSPFSALFLFLSLWCHVPIPEEKMLNSLNCWRLERVVCKNVSQKTRTLCIASGSEREFQSQNAVSLWISQRKLCSQI